MSWVRSNALSLFFLVLLLLSLVGQALAGERVFNEEQLAHHGSTLSLWQFVERPVFWGHVMENWQSEFLQFSLFIGATIVFVQRGSSESKGAGDEGADPRPPGLGGWLRANGLLIAMTTIFFATWGAQSLGNLREYNDDQRSHGEAAVSWSSYLHNADFWERTLQNWQSEFLAVGTMVVFSIHLRQSGSPESKRLDTPDGANEPTY